MRRTKTARRGARSRNKFVLFSAAIVSAIGMTARTSLGVLGVYAADDASTYSGNWTGTNNGTGFGNWGASSSAPGNIAVNGFFTASSAGNGNNPSGNIDVAGKSWGMYSNSVNTASVIRDLNTPQIGTTFLVKFDNGFDNVAGSSAGLQLQDSTGANLAEIRHIQGQANYEYKDNGAAGYTATTVPNALPFTTNGLSILFTQTDVNKYLMTANGVVIGTGTLNNSATFSKLRLYRFNNDTGGSSEDLYFNSIQQVLPTFNGQAGATGNWSVGANWTPRSPMDGGSIAFDGGVSAITANNDVISNVYNIAFNGTNAGLSTTNANGYTLTGNALSIKGGIDNNSTNVQTVNINLSLGKANTFSATNGDLVVGGNINLNGSRLTVTGAQNTSISGQITGTNDILKQGTGTLVLTGNNNFTGTNANIVAPNLEAAVVDNGTLAVGTGGTVGSTNGTTTGWIALGSSSVAQNGNNAALSIANSGVTVANPIDARFHAGVSGGKTITNSFASGAATYSGNILLHDSATFMAKTGTTLRFSGVVATGVAGTPFIPANPEIVNNAVPTGGVSAGPGLLVNNGTETGTVEMTGTNTYVGDTVINSGVLQFNNGTSDASTMRLRNASVLNLASATTVASTINPRPSSTATVSATNLTTTTATYSGHIGLDANLKFFSTTAGATMALTNVFTDPGTFATGIDIKGFTATFDGSGNTSVSGTIYNSTGSGSVIKTGTGTLTVANTGHNYDGTTAINAGKLILNGTLSSSASQVTVNNTGTLGGTGSVNRPVVVAAGGTLAPGNSIGTLHVNNSLALSGVSDFEISSTIPSNDKADGITALTYGGSLTVSHSGGSGWFDGQKFDLFDFTSKTGTFGAGITLPTLPTQFQWKNFGASKFDYANGLIEVQAITPARYSLSATTVSSRVLKNGVTNLSSTIVNTGVDPDDSINFTGLTTTSAANGLIIESPIGGTSGNLVNYGDTSTNSGLKFKGTGNSNGVVVTPAATVTSNVIGGPAASTGTSTVTIVVGNAQANRSSNNRANFGPALTGDITGGGSYAGLESTVTSTDSLSGGSAMLGSTATLLAGSASGATTVSMAWRTRNLNEIHNASTNPPLANAPSAGLASDVVNLTGIKPSGGGTSHGSTQTDVFVLQMSYDANAMAGLIGSDDAAAAAANLVGLAYLDLGQDGAANTSDDLWRLATTGNFGFTQLGDAYLGGYASYFAGTLGSYDHNGISPGDKSANSFALGDWGVDPANNVAWAVLDHNSQFAVVPEPSSIGLIGLAGAGLIARRKRRPRKSTT